MNVEMVMMTVRPEDAEVFLARRDAAMAAIGERYPELSAATQAHPRIDPGPIPSGVLAEAASQLDTVEQVAAIYRSAPSGSPHPASWRSSPPRRRPCSVPTEQVALGPRRADLLRALSRQPAGRSWPSR